MSLRLLKEHIKKDTPARAYVFFGRERYLLEYYYKDAIEKFMEDDTLGINASVFDAASLDMGVLLSEAQSYPVMARRRLIVINDLTPGSTQKADRERLCTFLEDAPDYLSVIFNYTDTSYEPDKTEDLKSLFHAAGAVMVKFSSPTTRELSVWIRRNFKAFGKTIDDHALRHLLDTAQNDMATLKHEIAKIAGYAGEDYITIHDIDSQCIPTLESKVYNLSDCLLGGRYAQAFTILDELKSQTWERRRRQELMPQITAYLTTVFSSVLKFRTAQLEGIPVSEAAQRLGYRQSLSLVSKNLAQKPDITFLKAAVLECQKTDALIKSSRVDKGVLLDLLVARIIAASGKEA